MTKYRYIAEYTLAMANFLLCVNHTSYLYTTLDDWLTPADAAQIYDIFYVFDTQNPDEFAAGEVPVVKEVGLFAYKYN